jgi:hypothetical protein
MNISTTIIKKTGFSLSILGLSIFFFSCGSYKEQVVDGIYDDGTEIVTEITESDNTTTDNYFKKELDKYENFENEEEIILNPDEYSSETETDDQYDTNASWGDEVDDTNITHHSVWYHPYHSYGYYGYSNFPRYRYYRSYRPHYYGYNSFYTSPYNSWYGYDNYYNSYYGGGYYNNYGYYNGNYYGGYGYGGYDDYYTYTPSNRYYGRRTGSAEGFGRRNSRRSLSQSILQSSNTSNRSIIRGNVDFTNHSARKSTIQTRSNTTAKPVATSITTRAKTSTQRKTTTRRNTTTKNRSYKSNTSKRRSSSTQSNTGNRRSSGTSSGSSSSRSSSSSSGKSRSSSSSSSGRRR